MIVGIVVLSEGLDDIAAKGAYTQMRMADSMGV